MLLKTDCAEKKETELGVNMNKIFLTVLVSLLVGCGVMPQKRADMNYLMLMQSDCHNAYIYIKFLQDQRDLNNSLVNKEDITENRKYNAAVTTKIWQIRSECQ